MASSVDRSQEDQIKDLLEDLDTYRYIYDDLLATRGECEEAAELRDTISEMEVKVATLLGDAVPTSQSATTPQVPSPTPAVAPAPTTPRMPSGAFTGIPGVPLASPHWPSAAPSPFVAKSRLPAQSSDSPNPPFPDISRKRARPVSGLSPTLQGSSKRSALGQIDSRRSKLEQIDADKETRISENNRLYREWMDAAANDPDAVQELRQERNEQARLIETEYQMERDAELARALQADEDFIQLPQIPQKKRNSWDLPDRTQEVKAEPGSNPTWARPSYPPIAPFSSDDDIEIITADSFNARTGKQPTHQPNHQPNPFSYPKLPAITQSYSKLPYPSQLSYSSQMPYPSQLSNPSQFSYPSQRPEPPLPHPFQLPRPSQIPSSPSMPSPRVLPWMGKSPLSAAPNPYEKFEKAFDLVRDQQDIWDDEIEVEAYNEREFPEDIKNLLNGIKDIREATKADNEETPRALRVTLMKHQKIGLKWMKAKEESSHKGGILADDMGLGKTIQAIALIVARPFEDESRRPTLIVAPKALMNQWKLEIERHVKTGRHKLAVLIYHQKRTPWKEMKNFDVIITTFGTLTAHYKTLLQATKWEGEGRDASTVRDAKKRAGPLDPAAKWHRVIVDEAQNIKNPAAKSAEACCRLNATYRWCLTGTPMMNRLEDFQSLLGFLRIRPYSNPSKFKAVSTHHSQLFHYSDSIL